MNAKVLKWVNTIAFFLMIVVNILANLVPFGIGTTGAVSQKYENLFTPAPITFFIWGVIYIFMALFIVYQWGWLDKGRRSNLIRKRIGLWFAITCLLNTAWIFAWHFDAILLSFILIAALLLTLTVIVEKRIPFRASALETVSVRVGFDIYFGWIIVAVIANACVLLTKLGWNGFGISDLVWMILLLAASTLIGIAAVLFRHRTYAALTMIWAIVGIMIRHISQTGYAGKYPVIIASTILSVVFLSMAVLFDFLRVFRKDEGQIAVVEYKRMDKLKS